MLQSQANLLPNKVASPQVQVEDTLFLGLLPAASQLTYKGKPNPKNSMLTSHGSDIIKSMMGFFGKILWFEADLIIEFFPKTRT